MLGLKALRVHDDKLPPFWDLQTQAVAQGFQDFDRVEQVEFIRLMQTKIWLCERGEGRTGCKKVKGLAKEHICMTHSYRQQCDEGQRERRGRGWVEVGKVAQNGDMYSNVNNKNKEK